MPSANTIDPRFDVFLPNIFVRGKKSDRSLKIQSIHRLWPEIPSQSANRFQFVLDDWKFFDLASEPGSRNLYFKKCTANLSRFYPPCGWFLTWLNFTSLIFTATYGKSKACSDLGKHLTSFFTPLGVFKGRLLSKTTFRIPNSAVRIKCQSKIFSEALSPSCIPNRLCCSF